MAEQPEDIPEFLNALPDFVPAVRPDSGVTMSSLMCLCAVHVLKGPSAVQVPDEFTEYFMERSGMDSGDPRL